MISKAQYEAACKTFLDYFAKANIAITPQEIAKVEVADFGLNELEQTGLLLLTYVNTDRVCAKELVCMPRQLCPEHWHPAVKGQPGKEETFRCRWGTFYLYVPGEPAAQPKATPPAHRRPYLTVWHEIILKPGEQYTLPPNTRHWFQSGDEGCVVSEFSTHSDDASDGFTDPAIKRLPVVGG